MFWLSLASFTLISTLVGTAVAQSQFAITSPGPNEWWVALSQNTLSWTCNNDPPATTYQLLVNNTNLAILTSPEAIVADVPNADCSFVITQQQANLTPATGYTLILADQLNQTHIYATSGLFEVKALGAAYPSATPTGNTSSTSTSSGSGTTSTASSTNKSNSAFTSFQVSGAGVLAAVGVAIGML